MQVYLVGPDGRRQYLHGPADLMGKPGDLVVVGKPSEAEAVHWSTALGLAVAFGASVRREL